MLQMFQKGSLPIFNSREKRRGVFTVPLTILKMKKETELHFVKKCTVSHPNNVLTVAYVILFHSFALFDLLEHAAA
jgi:hypothetical protein